MDLKLFSLNLHGHHPTGAPARWFEDRHGRLSRADSNLFFFTADELDRGSRQRLDSLAADLRRLAPDVLCLQEVAAGCPWTPRDEKAFLRADFPGDWFEVNSALRLAARLNIDQPEGTRYVPVLACRGNVGWTTSPGTFAERRVVTFEGPRKKVVFDFGDNPYAEGILVEGFALLVRRPWEVVEALTQVLPVNSRGQRFFTQVVALRHSTGGPLVLVANLHMGHKVTHFEQAVAVRRSLAKLAARWAAQGYGVRIIVTGDFNAGLYRPGQAARSVGEEEGFPGRPVGPSDPAGEPSTVPWELVVAGNFDFRVPPERDSLTTGQLLSALWRLNDDQTYKPWMSIRDPAEAGRRIEEAVQNFYALQEDFPEHLYPLRDVVETACAQGTVAAPAAVPSTHAMLRRIDFAFVDPGTRAKGACLLYPGNDWMSTVGLSDHPAVWAELEMEG